MFFFFLFWRKFYKVQGRVEVPQSYSIHTTFLNFSWLFFHFIFPFVLTVLIKRKKKYQRKKNEIRTSFVVSITITINYHLRIWYVRYARKSDYKCAFFFFLFFILVFSWINVKWKKGEMLQINVEFCFKRWGHV